jgi:hypothetical protein
VSRGGRRGKQAGKGFGLGFIGEHGLVEERERERGSHGPGSRRRAAPACPRVRGSRSAPAARRGCAGNGQRGQHGRWEEGLGNAWAREGRCRPATAREAAGGSGSRTHGRGRGDRGLEEDDGGPKCEKQKSQGSYYNA